MIERLRANLAQVRARIEAARQASPHAAREVQLVVVTKYAPASAFGLLAEAGVADVGESRVRAALARRPQAPPGLVWHGIGHLQRNKAARAVEAFDVFHALDSERLLRRLASVVEDRREPWPVHVEVNAARDPAKGGVAPEEALDLARAVAEVPALACVGFMTMARAPTGDAERDEAQAREAFRTLRAIRDDAVAAGIGREPPSGLSMGMSADYPWAVEEGATVVRVGSAIFRGLFAAHETTTAPRGEESSP